MAESTVATTPNHQDAPAAPTRASAAPDVAAPEVALDAEAQALVRALHPAASAGAAGGAGGSSPPDPTTWTRPRPRVGGRDLLALQRMAGNRAVSNLVARRSAPLIARSTDRQPDRLAPANGSSPLAAPTPRVVPASEPAGTGGLVTLARTSMLAAPAAQTRATRPGAHSAPTAGGRGMRSLQRLAPTVQRDDTKPGGGGNLGSESLEPDEVPAPPAGKALEIEADGLHAAVKKLAKGLTTLKGEVVVIGLQSSFMYVYNRQGVPISPRIKIELKKGMHFSSGVFVITPDGGQTQRLRINATTGRVQLAEVAGVLIEKPAPTPAPGAGGAAPGGAAGAAGVGAAPPAGAGTAGAGENIKATEGPSSFDLRDYIKDEAALNKALAGIPGNAWQFFLVPTISGGGATGKRGGARSTGFGGELEGHGTPPNRPPWPVTMDGPKTLPIGGQGTFAATINWAANGSNTLDMISAVMGNDIHYRWELFDITAHAKRQAEKEAERARQAKAAIEALMGTAAGGGPAAGAAGGGGAGASGGSTGGGAAKPAAKGVGAVAPPKPKAVGAPDEKSLADEILERQQSRVGSGADQNGITAGADFERDFEHLWGDTKRTWSAVGESKAETWAERRSEDLANVTAIGLLPVSALITLLGAGFRYGADKLAGERQQQDIPMPRKGTYLIRVIATPRIMTSSSGELIVRPSSVASQVVEVVEMEGMVANALRDPGTKQKEAENALAAAEKALKDGTGDQKTVDALKAQVENVRLELEGDPLKLLDKRIEEKEKELAAAKAKWEKLNIHGPIIDVENQLETLKKRRELYKLQEDRRIAGLQKEGKPIVPATRVNATLASELTGQPYPLLISIGPMGMAGTKHRWKVLDATSKKAEGFEGVGDTASEAVDNALLAFAADAQYGRGIIGVQLPKSLLDQLEPGAKADRRYTSAPAGWAVARGRLDDLVMTLAAIGLFVASAGTAAAILGGVIAAAKLVHRLHAGTLEMDVETVSDVLAIFGAIGALAQGAAQGAQATAKAAQAEAAGAKAAHVAGLKLQPLGELFVLAPETAALESNLAKASAALARAGALAKRVEWANEALGYAGLVWGNATFLMTMADISAQEAAGQISHSEARRQRANAIGGAIQNNGMFIAGNAMKAKAAAKAAKATSAAGKAKTEPSASSSAGAEPATPKPGTGAPGEPAAGGTAGAKETATPAEATTPKETPGPAEPKPGEKAAPQEQPTKGGAADEGTGARKPPEPDVPESAGGAKEVKPAETTPSEAPKPAPEGPAPGSKKGKAAAKQIVEQVGTGEKPATGTTVEEAIKLAGSWKEALKSAVSKLTGEERVAAEKALVETRDKMVNDTWEQVKAANKPKYDGLRLENAGTKSFGSDVDATVRPVEGTEAGAAGKQMAEQVKLAAEAAQKMNEALRKRLGGGETDVVLDTNIYSFIGEGRVKPSDPKAKGAQQQVDIVVGLAEQLRGQNEAQFKAFEQRLAAKLGDPRVAAEAKALLAKAREFHDARSGEWGKALAEAKAANPKGGEAAQKRAAREQILGAKKQELATLMAGEPPNYEAISQKQAEINWFAPDAYATPSAFKQAVAHGQRLKGTARTAAEYKGPEVAAKLREAAAKLKPDDPRVKTLETEAKRVESQQRLLDMTLREHKALQAESPMDAARVEDLARRAEQLREAIAAPLEKILVGEIMGETRPGDQPGPEQLSESAAASGANMGMLEDHVRHAPDLDGKVKAAAKYGARIAMAEWLGGLRPASDAIARLLSEFVKSRWDVSADIAPELLRDMFLKYALMTGRGKGIVHDKQGLAVGVTDEVKQAFVNDVTSWARSTNDGIQAAAIGSKVFDSPVQAAGSSASGASAPAAPTPAAPGGTGGGEGGTAAGPATPAPAERPTVPAPAPEAAGPTTPREGAGATPEAATPTGPAKAAPAEPGAKLEDIKGGIKVERDDFAVTVRAKEDPTALVRLEPQGNTLRLTDIYRRDMPPGTGVVLLAAAIRAAQTVRGNELLIHNILNKETVTSYEAGEDPAQSKLGRTAARALESAGFTVGRMRWEHVHGKLCISVEIK